MPRLRHLIFTIVFLLLSQQVVAVPQVVTSIKPINDLVGAVMEGVGQPVLLIPPGSSPHVYALKPSERLAAEKADVLFWIGPGVETSLAKVTKAMRRETRIVTLWQAPGITLFPARSGGQWDRHKHVEPQHGKHDDLANQNFDGHLWLSPANAAAIIREAVSTLSVMDKANAKRYAANAEIALQGLKVLDAELGVKLAPVQSKPFIVFHDAYQYFEKSYRLSAAGSVLISPEAMSSAGRVRDLRDRIVKHGAVCVFAELQFEPRLVQTLIEGTPARAATLDPLGAGLPSGMLGYEQLLGNLAKSMVTCLTQ